MRISYLVRSISALALMTSWNTLHAMQSQNLFSEPGSSSSSATRAVAAVPVIPSSTTGSSNPRLMERLGRSITPGRSTMTTTTTSTAPTSSSAAPTPTTSRPAQSPGRRFVNLYERQEQRKLQKQTATPSSASTSTAAVTTTGTTSTPSSAAMAPTASRPAQSPGRRVVNLYELQQKQKLQQQAATSSSASTSTAGAPTRPGVTSTVPSTRPTSAPRRPGEPMVTKVLPGANVSTLPTARPTSTERLRPSEPATSASSQAGETFEALMKQRFEPLMKRKKALEEEQKNTVQAREKALAMKEAQQQALDTAKTQRSQLLLPEAKQHFEEDQFPAVVRMIEGDERRAAAGVEKAQRDIQQADAALERIQAELAKIGGRGTAAAPRAVAPVPVVKPLPTAAPARPAAPQPPRISDTPAARAEVERLQAEFASSRKHYQDGDLAEYSEKTRIARDNLRQLQQQAPETAANPDETPRTTQAGVSKEQLDAARLKVAQWEAAEQRVHAYFDVKKALQRAEERLARAEEQDRLAQQVPRVLPLGAPLPMVRDINVSVAGHAALVPVAVTPEQLQNRLKAMPTTNDSIGTLVKETRQYLGRPATQTLPMSAAYHNALYHHYQIFHKASADKELPQEVNWNWMEMMTQIQTLRSKMEEEGLKPCGENDARRACEGLRGGEYPL